MVIFNEGLAKVAEQYLKKGSTVYIEGQLQTRKYTDKDGVEKYSTEVVLQGFNSVLTMIGGRGGAGEGAAAAWRRRRVRPVEPDGASARGGGGQGHRFRLATSTTKCRSEAFPRL